MGRGCHRGSGLGCRGLLHCEYMTNKGTCCRTLQCDEDSNGVLRFIAGRVSGTTDEGYRRTMRRQ